MSYIYQPFKNGVWYIQVCINGAKSRKSLKTTDKATAKRLQLLYDSKAAGIKTGLMSRRQQIDAVIQEYLDLKRPSIRPRSFERYVELAGKLTHHFHENKVAYIDQIDSGIVAKYFTARQECGVAPKTVDDELFFLRALLKWLLSENRISENPVRQWPKIRIVPKSPETLGAYSLEEIGKMKEFFRFREFKDCFLFALYTGCRREEMNLATVSDFDPAKGRIRLRNKKTETNPKDVWRYVSAHPELIKILTERCSDRSGTEKLFPELTRHSRNWPAVEIKAACKSEGIQYKRFHGLRHTFITHLLAGGVDIRQVQGAAGHTSLETTQGYLHLVEEVADVSKLKY